MTTVPYDQYNKFNNFMQDWPAHNQRFRKCGLWALWDKDLRSDDGGSRFATGFSGQFGRGGPGLGVSEVCSGGGDRGEEGGGVLSPQVGVGGGPRIAA